MRRLTKHRLSITAATALLLGLCGLASPGLADSLPASKGSTKDAPVTSEDDSAFLLRLQYTGEAWHNEGRRDANIGLQGIAVSLNVDAEKFGWHGARFYTDGFFVDGDGLIGYTGGTPISPLDGIFINNKIIRFYQAFYEQQIGATSFLFGFYDLQQHFNAMRPMEIFFNRGFAIDAPMATTGFLGGTLPPFYPNSTLGMRLKHKINDEWTVKLGVINGIADRPGTSDNDLIIDRTSGVIALGQVEYTPMLGTTFMAGYWNWTSKFTSWELAAPFTRKQYYGADGLYLGLTHRLLTIEGNRRVDGFFRWAIADEGTTLDDHSENAGVTITGLFEERPTDKLGFAVSTIHMAEPYQKYMSSIGRNFPSTETTFELTYRARINDWLTIQPNMQYVTNPFILPGADDAFIVGLHVEIGRDFKF